MAQNIVLCSSANDDQLTTMLSEALEGDDKQQFIINFQLYLSYGSDNTKYVIDLDRVWEWLGFATKGNAKKVLAKHFEKNVDYLSNTLIQIDKRVHGGQNKEQILLNVDTFKAFCMLCNTEKGKQTRRYYTKMESVFFKYLEEKNRATVLALQDEKNLLEHSLKTQKQLDIQRKLIDNHKHTPLVYILKIHETDEDNFVIKIGETDDIEQRLSSLRQEYKECILLDVFPCSRPHNFEQYILHRKDVMTHRFPGTETIQISEGFKYKDLVHKINKHVQHFDGISSTQRLELAKITYNTKLLDTIKTETDPNIKQQLIDILRSNANATEQVSETEDNEHGETPFRNRFVYQYEPSNLSTPVKVFNSLRQAARSLNNVNIHDYHIRHASNNNSVLENYRWYYVDGEAEVPTVLPETREEAARPAKNTGVIAQVNKDKTLIVNVFASQKEAEKETQVHNSQISIGVTTGKLRAGFYWMLYDSCSDELKQTFQGSIPEPRRPATCSKVVQRIDPQTNKVLETFKCIQDICNIYSCCHKSIKRASASGDMFKGFKWNIVNNNKL